MGLFDKLLHAGEGRKVKVLESVVPEVGVFEPEMERRTDAESERTAIAGLFHVLRHAW